MPLKSNNQETKPSSRHKKESAKEKEKLILTLGDNITAEEINLRVSNEKKKMDGSLTDAHPKAPELRQPIGLDQVFEIENTIIETAPKIKNNSVVKIKNIMY